MSYKQNIFKNNTVFRNKRKNFGSGKPNERVSCFYKCESWKECKAAPNELNVLEIKDK